MSKVMVTESYLQDVADAIREKGGTDTYTPAEMGDAIRDLPSGGEEDPYPTRNDGNLHLWVTVDDLARPDVTIRFRQTVSKAIRVNWGDGTVLTYSGTSMTNRVHNYEATGTYEIVLEYPTSGYMYMSSGYTSSVGIMGTANDSTLYNTGRLKAIEYAPMGTANPSKQLLGYGLAGCVNTEKITTVGAFLYLSTAIQSCTNLRRLYIGGTCQLYSTACQGLAKLESVEFSGSGKLRTGNNAFEGCTSLRKIVFGSDENSGLYSSFLNCSSLGEVTTPELSTNMTDAFHGCTSLRKVTFSQSVTVISTALTDCHQLQSVTVPSAVTNIIGCFTNCYSLKEIHMLPTAPPAFNSATTTNTLEGTPADLVIYVPSEALADYQAAEGWSDYASQIVGE